MRNWQESQVRVSRVGMWTLTKKMRAFDALQWFESSSPPPNPPKRFVHVLIPVHVLESVHLTLFGREVLACSWAKDLGKGSPWIIWQLASLWEKPGGEAREEGNVKTRQIWSQSAPGWGTPVAWEDGGDKISHLAPPEWAGPRQYLDVDFSPPKLGVHQFQLL